jgi:hypothetical protein
MVPGSEGGTKQHALAPNTWLHFAWLSNELKSPRFLLCPSDSGTPALDFTGDPTIGYLNPNFANRATSYFVSYIGFDEPKAILAGDRNITTLPPAGCGYLNFGLTLPSYPTVGVPEWDARLHIGAGNLLIQNGSVDQASTRSLRALLTYQGDGTPTKHIAVPR